MGNDLDSLTSLRQYYLDQVHRVGAVWRLSAQSSTPLRKGDYITCRGLRQAPAKGGLSGRKHDT